MMIGPRSSVVATLLGKPCDPLTDTSHWVMTGPLGWDEIQNDYPELWVDLIHDYIHEGD